MVAPADNGRARRLPLDGTAMSSDDADAAVLAYNKGREDERRLADAAEAAEERRWRTGFATLLAALVLGVGTVALAIYCAGRSNHADADALLRALARTNGK